MEEIGFCRTSYPIVNWPLRSTIELWIFPQYRQIVLLHPLLEELMDHVVVIRSWLFDTAKQY